MTKKKDYNQGQKRDEKNIREHLKRLGLTEFWELMWSAKISPTLKSPISGYEKMNKFKDHLKKTLILSVTKNILNYFDSQEIGERIFVTQKMKSFQKKRIMTMIKEYVWYKSVT